MMIAKTTHAAVLHVTVLTIAWSAAQVVIPLRRLCNLTIAPEGLRERSVALTLSVPVETASMTDVRT